MAWGPEKYKLNVVKIVWGLGSILSLYKNMGIGVSKYIFVDKVVSEYL